MADEHLHSGIESIRQIEIIAIKPTENISRGTSKTFVDCRRLAIVLAGAPESQGGIVFLEGCDGPVLAPSVQNQIFKIRILLPKHAENRLLDELALVVRGSNNRDFWIGHDSF